MKMNKTAILFLISQCFLGIVSGQGYLGLVDSSKISKPAFKYQPEYTFDSPVDPNRWQKEAKGLHTAFVSTDEAYFRTEVPDLRGKMKQ